MSSIYDIAGTTSDSFSLNGKCTLLQGSDIPSNYQGQDGDIYFRDNGYLYTKSGGEWNQVNATSLPTAQESANKFLYSNGETYQASQRSVDEIVYVDNLQNSVSDLQTELQNVDNSTLHKTGDDEITLTKGNYNTRVVQQADGNFVIYKNGKAVLACHNEEILSAPNNVNATITHSIVTTTGIQKAANGYVKFGNGIILQWGNTSSTATVTLPTAFTTTNYVVTASTRTTGNQGNGWAQVKDRTTTTFYLEFHNYENSHHSNSTTRACSWMAIGF